MKPLKTNQISTGRVKQLNKANKLSESFLKIQQIKRPWFRTIICLFLQVDII